MNLLTLRISSILFKNDHPIRRGFLLFAVLLQILAVFPAYQARAQGISIEPRPDQSLTETSCLDLFTSSAPVRIDITCGMLKGLNYIAEGIFSGVYSLANEAVLGAIHKNTELSSAQNSAFVRVGWPIIRDIANIFYVFILLWIALATIFDYSTFSARNLLPRFIVSALLINFSLVIGTTVISAANNIGMIYYGQVGTLEHFMRISLPAAQIIKKTETPNKDNPAAEIDKKRQLEKLYNKTEIAYYYKGPSALFGGGLSRATIKGEDCKNLKAAADRGEAPSDIDIRIAKAEACAKAAGNLWKNADFIYMGTDTNGINRILAKQFIVKLIVYIPMLFVLFAIAILLLVRYVSLLFLLVLGPFAFLSMILPATQKYWHDWWDKLIKWSVFFPAFSIMYYISIKSLITLSAQKQEADVMDYLLSMAFMVGTLIVAQQLGIAGASTAMAYGKKWAGAAGDYAKGKGMRVAGKAAEGGLAAGLGRIPLARTLLARTAVAGEKQRKADEKSRLGFAKGLPERARANWLANKSGSEAAAFMNSLDPKGRQATLKAMDANSQMTLMRKLQGVNSEHLVRDFTGDPRVYLRATNAQMANMSDGDPQFQTQVRKITNERFSGKAAKNLSSDFIRSEHGRQWLRQDATGEQLSAIGSTIQGVADLQHAISERGRGGFIMKGSPDEQSLDALNPADYRGEGAADFWRSMAGRVLFKARERRGPLQGVRAAIKMEVPGQTTFKTGEPEEVKEDIADVVKKAIKEASESDK